MLNFSLNCLNGQGKEPVNLVGQPVLTKPPKSTASQPLTHGEKVYLKLDQMADAVIALTQAAKRILMGLGVPEKRIAVTGVGSILAPTAYPTAFLNHYGLEAPIGLFLGQHYPYKGYQQMLQAAPLVWQQVPEAQFVFIGSSVADSEQAFAQISDRRIHRLGTVDLQTKTNALAACIYTKAWSFGKPVIGCDIPAVAEVLNNGVDGLLTKQEPAEIADRLLHLLLNPSQAIAMGTAGKHKTESRFTWKKSQNRWRERIEA